MNILEIKNLSLKISDEKILKNINFELKEKEIISIIGKSGSGKTMLSKMIMGLKNKNMQIEGEILFKDNNIFDFRESKKLEEFFKADDEQKTLANNGIDHPYIFNKEIGKLEIKNLESGIKISVETDNPAVVIYTANYLQDIGFKKHSAICFETQETPNLYRDEDINIYPTFIDKNTNYGKYTKFIFEIN
mgnify:CR=1 FL=1